MNKQKNGVHTVHGVAEICHEPQNLRPPFPLRTSSPFPRVSLPPGAIPAGGDRRDTVMRAVLVCCPDGRLCRTLQPGARHSKARSLQVCKTEGRFVITISSELVSHPQPSLHRQGMLRHTDPKRNLSLRSSATQILVQEIEPFLQVKICVLGLVP